MILLCVTLLGCSGRMLGWFLPATLGVGWKVLQGTAGALLLGWNGVGTQQGFVLVSAFLMLLGSWDTSVS